MRFPFVSLIAAGTTILGILIGIFAASPAQWSANLAEWGELLALISAIAWPGLLALLLGALGFLLGRHVFAPGAALRPRENVVSESMFAVRLEAIAREERVSGIDVLSYTAETIADILKYDFRNHEGLLLRTLSRSWVDEAADEAAYNVRLAGSKKRRWDKADAIERSAHAPWPYQGKRQHRFYIGMHPLLKLVLVHYGKHTLGFCSFYDWQEWPEAGGSPFKGSSNIGFLLDSQNPSDADILQRLQHQYEFIWEYGSLAPEQVSGSSYASVFEARLESQAPRGATTSEVDDGNAQVRRLQVRGKARVRAAKQPVHGADGSDVSDE